jgi:hypothetical protein
MRSDMDESSPPSFAAIRAMLAEMPPPDLEAAPRRASARPS